MEGNMFNKNETIKVKGVAVLLLMFHHLFYNANQVEQSGMKFLLLSEDKVQPIAVAARICVWIFAFLSAYGLTYSYNKNKEKETCLQFIVKHWLSLMKTYWIAYVCVFISYMIVVGNPMQVYENSFKRMLLDFMGWGNFFQTPMLINVWWYMCFAQILIIVIPLVDVYCEKFGMGGFVLGFFILQYLPEGITSIYSGKYSIYFLVIILGTICAKNQVLDKILQKSDKGYIKAMGKAIALICAVIVLLMFKYKIREIDQWQISSALSAISTLFIVIIVSKYIRGQILVKGISFLGKHSGNIFMIHAFFYTYCQGVVYWSRNALLSYITLVCLSLLLSIVIEFIKKFLQYNELIEKMSQQIVVLMKY